jgi:hypothetical protein
MTLINITAAAFCILLIVLFVCIATLLVSTTADTINDIRKTWRKKRWR